MDENAEVLAARFDEYRKGHEREHALESTAAALQSTENLRRLDELNHAHAQSVADKAAFLTTAIFDAKHDATVRRIEALQQSVAGLVAEAAALHQEVQTIKLVVYGAVFLALTAVAAAILQLVVVKR